MGVREKYGAKWKQRKEEETNEGKLILKKDPKCDIPLYMRTTTSLSIHLSIDT